LENQKGPKGFKGGKGVRSRKSTGQLGGHQGTRGGREKPTKGRFAQKRKKGKRDIKKGKDQTVALFSKR